MKKNNSDNYFHPAFLIGKDKSPISFCRWFILPFVKLVILAKRSSIPPKTLPY